MASRNHGRSAASTALSTFLTALGVVAAFALLAASPAAAKPTCGGEQATIVGKPKGDTINGTDGDDVIRARAGDDIVNAGGGNDIICGGIGNDEINAEGGNDRVRTGNGDDTADGGEGDDDMRGQGAADEASGGPGVDACRFEQYSECEADLRVNVEGPDLLRVGDPEPSVFTITLRNAGPSTAKAARVSAELPESFDFVGSASDGRCSAAGGGEVSCPVGPMGADTTTTLEVAVVNPECPLPGRVAVRGSAETVSFTASATDQGTNDHVAKNNSATTTSSVGFDQRCFQQNL